MNRHIAPEDAKKAYLSKVDVASSFQCAQKNGRHSKPILSLG